MKLLDERIETLKDDYEDLKESAGRGWDRVHEIADELGTVKTDLARRHFLDAATDLSAQGAGIDADSGPGTAGCRLNWCRSTFCRRRPW